MNGRYLLDTNTFIYAINRKLALPRNFYAASPDSIISATAITGEFTLVTDDDKLRKRHVGKAISLEELLGGSPL